jgi:hypothetical protein
MTGVGSPATAEWLNRVTGRVSLYSISLIPDHREMGRCAWIGIRFHPGSVVGEYRTGTREAGPHYGRIAGLGTDVGCFRGGADPSPAYRNHLALDETAIQRILDTTCGTLALAERMRLDADFEEQSSAHWFNWLKYGTRRG